MTSDSQQPLVTILTPSFNRADFLPETIASVLAQDYPHVEHLVLDDGSTDGTPALLERYERTHAGRFRSVRHENMGQPRTLNRGFELARGELAADLVSDDTLLEHAIAHLVAALLAEDRALAAFPDYRVIDEHGTAIVDVVSKSYSFAEMVRTQNNFLSPGVLFKKTLAKQLGGWDDSYRIIPDFDFWLRGGLRGEYVHVPEILATWRQHSGSITVAGHGTEEAPERLRLIAEFFARADLPSEIRALEPEAYRNVYFIVALGALPEINRPEDRFVVHDRLAWSQDSRAQGTTIESELLAQTERADRLDEALADCTSHCSHLLAAVEVRDRKIRERDETLADVRASLARLEQQTHESGA